MTMLMLMMKKRMGQEVQKFLLVSIIVVSHVKPLNLSNMAPRIRFTREEKKDDK